MEFQPRSKQPLTIGSPNYHRTTHHSVDYMGSRESLEVTEKHCNLVFPMSRLGDEVCIGSIKSLVARVSLERPWQQQGTYRKILKISPGAYIFQRPLLRSLFLEGLIFGGTYLRTESCVSKSIGLAL